MKKVFNNSELAHTYAQQTQSEGRTSNGSFYFHGSTLYSYGSHFPICKFITDANGQSVLLFTQRTYSNTTAKQISLARNATSQYNKVYCNNPTESHESNFNTWVRQAEQLGIKLQKAKKPELYLTQLGFIENSATAYANCFNILIPIKLQTLLNIKDKSEYVTYMENKSILDAIENKRKATENKKQFKESFKKWITFETPYLYNRINYDFLRLNSERIDTTQGVQIPVPIAKRLYNSIKENTLQVGDKVLNFTINEIGKEIKIGCHTFKRSYLLNFGAKLA